jgi:hypothetical protein
MPYELDFRRAVHKLEAAPLFFATAVPPGVLQESRTIEEGGRARVASDGDEKRVISMNNLASPTSR